MENNIDPKRQKELAIKAYMDSVRQAESGGDDTAKAKTSSATGRYQFTESTWKAMEKALGKKLDIYNGAHQELAMRKLTEINADALSKKGLPVNNETLYMTHFLGSSGGTSFLKNLDKNPNELASKYMSDGAVKANKSLLFRDGKPVTAAELYNKMAGKVSGGQPQSEVVQERPRQLQGNDFVQDQIPEQEIDNTSVRQPRVQKQVNSKPVIDYSKFQFNSKDSNRKRLGLIDDTDFLPADVNLAFGEEEQLDEEIQNPEDMVSFAKYGGIQKKSKNYYEEGGSLLTEFNEGGSHEENPHGGIPQGIGENGKPNTVEEGEAKFNDYVLSDTLRINEDDIESAYLPKDIKPGMTFSEAGKLLNEFTKENPSDRIMKKTTQKHLDSLTMLNEKARLAKQELDMNLGISAEESNQMFSGGSTSAMSGFSFDLNNTKGNSTPDAADNTGMSGNTASTIGTGLGAIGTGLSSMKEEQKYYDPTTEKQEQTADMVGKTKDSVAAAVGPWGTLFRGIEKAGQGMGDAIGGDTGNYVKYAFSPDEAMMKANQDPDIKTSDKLLGMILPFHAAKMSRKAEQNRQREFETNKNLRQINAWNNDFALGGSMTSFDTDPPVATKQDTMSVQKYSKDKIAQLEAMGYKRQGTWGGRYDDVHSKNNDALMKLREESEKGIRRRVIDKEGRRLDKVYDASYYQRPHKSDPNKYYNQEGATGLGVVNPNANYLLFDKRISPNVRSEWKHPTTRDGVEVYEYDFGAKYDKPKPKPAPKGSGQPIKKRPTGSLVNKQKPVRPEGVSPVSLGYNDFEEGGDLFRKRYSTEDDYYDRSLEEDRSPLEGTMTNDEISRNLAGQYRGALTEQEALLNTNTPAGQPSYFPYGEYAYESEAVKKAVEKDKQFKTKGKSPLQYAGALGSALNFLEDRKEKAEVERLNRLDKRYRPEYVDEEALVNKINAGYNNTLSALEDASGGSSGRLSANILAASANRGEDTSDAYMKMEEINRGQREKGQSFDLGIDQFNVSQDNSERDINARNRAVTADRKRASRDALFRDIGSIGREITYDNRLYNITGGYNSMGKYSPEEIEIIRKTAEGNNSQEYGGDLSNLYSSTKNLKKKTKAEEEFTNYYR